MLLLSAFMSSTSSAIQWQRHQLSAIAAAQPPANKLIELNKTTTVSK